MSACDIATLCASSVLFALANRYLPRCLYPSYPLTGYLEWKWRNIAISLAHSLISGVWALCLSLDYYQSEPPGAYEWLRASMASRQLLCMSIGYFVYDTLLSFSRVRTYPGRVEIIVHHVITMTTLGLSLFHRPLLNALMPFCASGLVVELNNVFIHLRSLMELAHVRAHVLYKTNSAIALVSIFIFRFAPLVRIHQDVLLLPESTSSQVAVRVLVHFPIVAIVLISCVIFVRIIQEDFLGKNKKLD